MVAQTYPYISLLQISRENKQPIYLQLANAVIQLIRTGVMGPGEKLPAIREMSSLMQLHQKTIVAAYDEIVMQGWVMQQPRKGFFVINNMPVLSPEKLPARSMKFQASITAGFEYNKNKTRPYPDTNINSDGKLVFNDGFPDVRLAPLDDLLKAMRGYNRIPVHQKYRSYTSAQGTLLLRGILSDYLNHTRGLRTSAENILITRGAQMGLFIAASVILNKGDEIIVGAPGYDNAEAAFAALGAKINFVPMQDDGIDTQAIQKICKRKKIKLLYIIPHHHNPTTVTLSAEKRIQLLQLAEQNKFAVLEDDYDYDFHYAGRPIMPMASLDKKGHVVYVGTLAKTLAPGIRIGFLVAQSEFIQYATGLRKTIDRQGDSILENAIALLYREGVISRHIKKSVKLYRERRDHLCNLLQTELRNRISFKVPDGGMSVWANFNTADLSLISEKAFKKGLIIRDGRDYDTDKIKYNSVRLGFASLNFNEQEKAVAILKQIMF
jgi:GntR family transcriptional regulator/MocR family aminotransferase